MSTMRSKAQASFDRTNTSAFGRWWWTVDRISFFILLLLICLGAVLVTAGSPPVARRINLDPFYFVSRQEVFLALSIPVMIGISMLPVQHIRRLAVLGFLGSIVLLAILPFMGAEIKGAKRWLSIAGMTVQPSEFIKPCFAVVMAWMLAERWKTPGFPGYRIGLALFGLVAGLLIIQPDFGMVITISAMFGAQLFLAGLPFMWVVAMICSGGFGVVAAYHTLPHVAKRIDGFLSPDKADNYQVGKSIQAFESGGFFGRGPGEGEVKWFLPDSHTDFIFSVAAEEFGALVCLGIVTLYAVFVLRGFIRMIKEPDMFVMLAASGILVQFGIQAVINMGVAVQLLPAKGMTLPFLSYGGSSLLAIALAMGMLLGFSRRRFGTVGHAIRKYGDA